MLLYCFFLVFGGCRAAAAGRLPLNQTRSCLSMFMLRFTRVCTAIAAINNRTIVAFVLPELGLHLTSALDHKLSIQHLQHHRVAVIGM